MCLDRRKNHGCGQEKPKSTSSAIFGAKTAAKCCEHKRCADRVRNRTDKANLNFSPELYGLIFFRLNWTFPLPPKRQLSILLNFFFAINKFAFEFCCLFLFCYNAGHHAISRQEHATSYWWPYGADGRSRDFYVTTKISRLDRLPNSLSNGAMVLCWLASARASLWLDTTRYVVQNRADGC